MGFWLTLKQGQRYADSWIMHPKLATIFPENRIIKATKFAQQAMPFIAVLAISWQQLSSKGNDMAFTAAILTALFALCIPLQGLYWLGKRAKTPLNTQSAVKFQQISQQLTEKHIPTKQTNTPTFQDLSNLLQQADQHLGQAFWREL